MSDPDVSGEFVDPPTEIVPRGYPPLADKLQGALSFASFSLGKQSAKGIQSR